MRTLVRCAECTIPTCGLEWIPTKQPIVLDEWPVSSSAVDHAPFTSIGAWRGPHAQSSTTGRRSDSPHQFRKLLDLPRRTGQAFEVALDLHINDDRDRTALADHGWKLAEPRTIAADPWVYREDVATSRGEFGVAKNIYVQSRSGWFSDRSICYLASGRPVIVQDTGLAKLLPIGQGLLTYETLDGAVDAVARVNGDMPGTPGRHGQSPKSASTRIRCSADC